MILQLSGKPGQYVLVFGARPQNPGVTYVDHYPFLCQKYSKRLQAIQRALRPAAALAQNVRVDHRRGHIVVPQQLLDGTDVRATLEQGSCKTVSKSVT
jgi:hypothetical protein